MWKQQNSKWDSLASFCWQFKCREINVIKLSLTAIQTGFELFPVICQFNTDYQLLTAITRLLFTLSGFHVEKDCLFYTAFNFALFLSRKLVGLLLLTCLCMVVFIHTCQLSPINREAVPLSLPILQKMAKSPYSKGISLFLLNIVLRLSL